MAVTKKNKRKQERERKSRQKIERMFKNDKENKTKGEKD